MAQGAVAERLKVSEGYMSRIEKGTAKVSLARLWEIADLLEVDISLLVSDKSVLSETPVNSEIYQLIKDWSPKQISLLADLLSCANEKMESKE